VNRCLRTRLAVAPASVVALAATSTASGALASRAPTLKEREAITKALPQDVRNTPVECLWLDIRVSRNSRYARVAGAYLNTTGQNSRCIRYASNGFFILKKLRRWKVIYIGSTPPRCSLGVPRDLTPCRRL
jgi:hypothetical protein